MTATKSLNMNGRETMVTGMVERELSRVEKADCELPLDGDYLLVSFCVNDVQFRGAWAKSECRLEGDLVPIKSERFPPFVVG